VFAGARVGGVYADRSAPRLEVGWRVHYTRQPVEYMPLGPLEVSRVGLGCNNFGGRLELAGTRAVVDAAIDAGITFLDTADIYGNRSGAAIHGRLGASEALLGELLQGRRDRVVLATKFGGDMGDGASARGAPAYVRLALDRSLERLRTDHVDLLYYHWPDDVTPIGETVAAMAELVRAGKVRAIGVSNLTGEELDEAARAAPIAALQNEYSLLERGPERELLPRCRALGVGFVPYYPLASGLLTGKYRHGLPPPQGSRWAGEKTMADGTWVSPGVEASQAVFGLVDRLAAYAQERGRSVLELAIAGLASQPGVASVIAGATTPAQVRANAVAGDWRMTAEELAAIPTA
jgi:aryl-alcohol dehydrogenase-like predicted oxidoreductase